MSEDLPPVPTATTAAPQPKKMTLMAILERINPIAAGADKAGRLPGAEGYDATTAPDGATRWCASVLRIVVGRTIDYVQEFKRDIAGLKAATKDLPAMRDEIKEMTAIVNEIVGAIRAAEALAHGQAPPPMEDGAKTDESTPKKNAAEALEAAGRQAFLDDLTARVQKGEITVADAAKAAAVRMEQDAVAKATADPPPLAPPAATVTPIQSGGQGNNRRRNPAGNEKV